MALRSKKVTINDQDFTIGSLSVRQFGALMEARKQLFGDDPKPEDYQKKPLNEVSAMEAEFLLVPSLNNAMVQNIQQAITTDADQKQAAIILDGDHLNKWTVDRVLDEFDYETMRELTKAIMDFMNLAIKSSAGPQAVLPSGESKAVAS